MGVLGTQSTGPTGATGEQNLRLLAKSADELRAAALVQKYPAYVRPAPGAAKVLVLNETEHRIVAPHDFEDDEAPARRRPGRPRKVDEPDEPAGE